MTTEIWKDIPGYEDYYQASTMGRIRSKDQIIPHSNGYYRKKKGKVLSPGVNMSGYLSLVLYNPKKTFVVHRLVAITFLDNPENKPCINHIDCNKKNNSTSNLEFCTYSENHIHAYKNGLMYAANKGRYSKDAFNSKPVIQLSKSDTLIKIWHCASDASNALGICFKGISAVCRGVQRTAGGYKWLFADKI